MAQKTHHFDVLCFLIYCCCWRLSLWVVLNYFLCYIGMDILLKTQPVFIFWLLSIVISRLFYQSAQQLRLGPYLGSGFCCRQIFISSNGNWYFIAYKKNSNVWFVIRTMSEEIYQIHRKRQCSFNIHLNWEKCIQLTCCIEIPLKNTFMI